MALTEGGALYGAGASAYGQFASDTPLDPDSGTQWKGWHPLERFSGESITAMACSEFHGVAVTEDRKVCVHVWPCTSPTEPLHGTTHCELVCPHCVGAVGVQLGREFTVQHRR